jgi:hypothetical protein
VNVLGAYPFDRQFVATLTEGRERVPQLGPHPIGEIQGDERSNRLPRR